MTDNFPSIAFQSSLTIAGILFGVFGFLYSLYGLYKPQITPTNLQNLPIVPRLKLACRIITVFIVIDTAFTLYSAFVLDSCGDLPSIQDKILGFGLAAMVLLIAIISLIGAIWHMN